jgi:hypothetical protein
MGLMNALFYCQLGLLFISCSTLGPREKETMLVGRLIVNEFAPQTTLHHLEFFGVVSSPNGSNKIQRFYGVWLDKKTNAFSIPVPWSSLSKAITLKQMAIFLTTPMGEQKLLVDINLEVLGEEQKCLDLGDWTIDLSNTQLLSMNRIISLQENPRIELFKHCPQD